MAYCRKRNELPLYHPSFFVSGPKETPPHSQTDPPAYLVYLLCSEDEREARKRVTE